MDKKFFRKQTSRSKQALANHIASQLRLASFLLPSEELDLAPDRVFSDNRTLWDSILKRKLRANITIRLDNFIVSEWIPRAPGLYHTESAARSRNLAASEIIFLTNQEDLMSTNVASKNSSSNEGLPVFAVPGKRQMVEGGIGCIRLAYHETAHGGLWFMSASSTHIVHEGFPIALPDHLYQRYYDQLVTDGGIVCSLTGKLHFIPDPLVLLYQSSISVPQVYLLVDEIQIGERRGAVSSEVTAAVTFERSSSRGSLQEFSYMTFDSSSPLSLEQRAEWLNKEYVQKLYQGRIVIDFDEQVRHFADAVFSLHKVMTGKLESAPIDKFFRDVHIHGDVSLVIKHQEFIFSQQVRQGDTVEMHGSNVGILNTGHLNNVENVSVTIQDAAGEPRLSAAAWSRW